MHTTAHTPAQQALYRKIQWRLLPFIMLCYFICYLDRVNIGFAKLEFLNDLGLTDGNFGFATALFFVTYSLFDIPSNLLLARIGVRKTLTRIMVTWGILSGLQLFIHSAGQLYVLRLLFGAAEAGFIPGIMLYLTYWFPNALRGRVTSLFLLGIPVSGIVGAPLSGVIMQNMQGVFDLHGWQWLFLIEALPAVIVGVIAYFYLDNGPADARWLSPAEKSLLANALALDRTRSPHARTGSLGDVLRDPRLYLIAAVNFAVNCVTNAVSFWTPSILKSVGIANVSHIGYLTGGMSTVAALGMVLVCRRSDRTMERHLHFTVMGLLAAASFIALPLVQESVAATVGIITCAAVGSYCVLALYWTIPTAYMQGKSAAGGLAFVSMVGAIGSGVSPSIIGWLKVQTGTLYSGLLIMGIIALAGVALVWIAVPPARMRVASHQME